MALALSGLRLSIASSLTVGLAAAGVAAVLLSTGTLLQALEARGVEHHHGMRLSMLGRLLRRPRWLAGTIIGYLAFPFQLIALAHASLVVVQPIHAGGLLLLLIAGVVLLDERVRAADLAGAAAILAGLAIISWGAPRGTSDLAVSQAAFATVVAVLLVVSLSPYPVRDRCGRVVLMLSAALGFTCANLAVKGISDALAQHNWAVAIGYLAAAAVSSSVGVLSQMTAFQRHRAIQVLPMTYAIPIFLPALLGLFLLRQKWGTAPYGGGAFAVGALVLLAGTVTVARSQSVVDISRRAAG